MLQQIIPLNDAGECQHTTVFLHGTEYEAGYHNGYEHFLNNHQGKAFTDTDIGSLFMNQCCDATRTDRYHAGFISGWCHALHNDRPQPIQVIGVIGKV